MAGDVLTLYGPGGQELATFAAEVYRALGALRSEYASNQENAS